MRPPAAALLARAYFESGRLDDADLWADRAAALGASDDALTQLLLRQVRARVLSLRAEHAEAARLAHEAVAIADRTEQALARYERKGNLVMASRIRMRLGK